MFSLNIAGSPMIFLTDLKGRTFFLIIFKIANQIHENKPVYVSLKKVFPTENFREI